MRLTILVVLVALGGCSKMGADAPGSGGAPGAGRGGTGGSTSGLAGVGGQPEPDPACMLAGGACAWASTSCPNVGPQPCDTIAGHGSLPAIDQICCLPCPSGQHGVYADGGGTCQPVQSQSVCGGSTDHVEAARIHQTASTNSPTVDIVVYCDASAERTLGNDSEFNVGLTPMSFPAGAPEIVAFLVDLDASGDVSELGARTGCPKSASFGTVTTITALGKTSGDVQCLYFPTPAETALSRDCNLLTQRP